MTNKLEPEPEVVNDNTDADPQAERTFSPVEIANGLLGVSQWFADTANKLKPGDAIPPAMMLTGIAASHSASGANLILSAEISAKLSRIIELLAEQNFELLGKGNVVDAS